MVKRGYEEPVTPVAAKRTLASTAAQVTVGTISPRCPAPGVMPGPTNVAASTAVPVIQPVVLKAYQALLCPEGLAFLFSQEFSNALQAEAVKALDAHGVNQHVALEEFRQLLGIKAYTTDTDAEIISPTALMDQLWHAIILDTKFYPNLQAALGVVLYYDPLGASDQQTEHRKKR